MTDRELIEKFNKSKDAKHTAIAYGGDGELLKVVAEVGTSKGIVPIRNYGQCPAHTGMLEAFVEKTDAECVQALRYSKQPFIECSLNGNGKMFPEQARGPVAEIVWRSADPTSALRFSVLVNGKTYMKQCIADGVICSTALGSHGYFKSVTRTIFNDVDALGLGFIAPTYGLCNLVLKLEDQVKIVLERDALTTLSGDKCYKSVMCKAGAELDLQLSNEGVALYGYDIFCCPECRRLRNSTTVNDQYLG